MTTLALAGCRPEPLGSYLKALGVLRLVGEQVDLSTAGWWEGDTFRLESSLDAEGLTAFLVERYQPTPVLSPWNKDSGFKEAGSTATTTLLSVESSDDPRFAAYREAITVVRELRSEPAWGNRSKAEQVSLLRNRLPDAALDWLDAAIVLRAEKPEFPPLLGAGGNLGRLELSPSFMARLRHVLDPTPTAVTRSVAWLQASLFEKGAPELRSDPVGQFDPGAAGGVRADAFGLGKPVTNPWDLVLVIEGSLVWASGVARRLGGATSLAAIPFTVWPSSVGQASLSRGETAKAELWAPIWSDPLSLPALRRLFAEGRISWSAKQARSGLDVARALSTLGVDAGIAGFVRHVIAARMGQSPLAIPVGRFDVRARPAVAVLASLDPWVDRFRRAASSPSAPTSMARAAHRIDTAMFAAASGRAADLQEALIAVADAEAIAGRTERGRSDGPVRPLPWLSPTDWLPALDDASVELRLAAAVALGRDENVTESSHRAGIVRSLLRPVRSSRRRGDAFGGLEWAREGAMITGFGDRPVVDVLADVLVARSEAERVDRSPERARPAGVEPWFPMARSPISGDAEAFAAGGVDLDRFGELLAGLLLLAPEPRRSDYRWRVPERAPHLISPAWRVLVPFFSRHAVPTGGEVVRLRPQLGWARRLRSGDGEGVLTDALLRWQLAGFSPVYGRRSALALATGVNGVVLAAALMCGASRSDVQRAAAAVTSPESDPQSEGELT